MQSWASSSILLASPSTTTNNTTLLGTPQPMRREEGSLKVTTAAAAAATFPPSRLRVGNSGGRSQQKGSQEEVPLRPYLPSPPPPPAPPQLERVNSAVPIVAASSLPQSILTHPVYKTLGQQPLCYQTTAIFFWSGRVAYSGFEGSVASGHFAWAMSSCHILSFSHHTSSVLKTASLVTHWACAVPSLQLDLLLWASSTLHVW